MFAADLDGDGDTDVLSASQYDDKVSWYENDGEEHFSAHAITLASDGPHSAFPADMDRDGDLDVVSASYEGDKVTWYEDLLVDFGDAPDPGYATLLASDGARHEIISGLCLGQLIDADTDGQPTAGADGDDANGTDDEDGVSFSGTLAPGDWVTVTATASAEAKLDAWFDWNADGDWDDAGEQFLASRSVVAGANTFNLLIPANAAPGVTYARFRLSTAGGLAPTGAAEDGEVEDYSIEILAPTGEIRGYKWADLDLDGQEDRGEPRLAGWTIYLDVNYNGQLDAGDPVTTTLSDDAATPEDETGTYVFSGLPAGTYLVCEVLPPGSVQTFPALSTDIQRVSVAADGTQANDRSWDPSVSADGRFVAFESPATDLLPDDTNGTWDVFVYDVQTRTIERVSVAADGSQGNGISVRASLSGDGRFVAFVSGATNLVPDDTNGVPDVFVYDRQTGAIERVSLAADGSQANGTSDFPTLSADGRFVAFGSDATNLVANDTNAMADLFVYDRQTGTTERLGLAGQGALGVMVNSMSFSADGRFVAFDSWATDLVADDTNAFGDVFVYDRQTGAIERVSVAADGTQANNWSLDPSLSADGRFVAFESFATNLVPGDTVTCDNIFVYDRETGAIERVSAAADGTPADSHNWDPALSADGRFVSFESFATNLVPGDTNGRPDVFVYDRHTRGIERVSVSAEGAQGDGGSERPTLSADGRFVAFLSLATNLVPGDTNGKQDVFVVAAHADAGPSVQAVVVPSGGVVENIAFGNAPPDWSHTAEDLGTVDFLVLPSQDPAAGDRWYRFVTARAGTLTVDATYDPGAGAAEVMLYDAAGQQLAHSQDGLGYERIDHACGAGETYFACLSGDNAGVDLRLANLVQQSGTAVAVAGTGGDDTFSLEQAAEYTVTVNGVAYHFDPAGVNSIGFDGLLGGDSAVLGGSLGVDTVEMAPGTASLNTGSLLATVVNCPSITIRGGGGADTVVMNDSGEDDTFTFSPQTATLSGPGFTSTVEQMPNIYVYARNGGHDVAYLDGGSGKDKIKFQANVAWMYGGNYYVRPKFFDEVRANGKGGTTDTAIFYNTPGVDVLVADPNVTTVTTGALVRKATGFENVTVYGTNIDTATFNDSPGDDIFNGLNHKSYMYGSGYKIVSRGFKKVTATASTGFDKARLYDTIYDDRYECRPGISTLTGGEPSGLRITAQGFDKVSLVPTLGGFDAADLYDTEGDDRLDASGSLARLYRNAAVLELLYEALSVDRVTAHGSTGTNARNVTEPLAFDLVFEGVWEP